MTDKRRETCENCRFFAGEVHKLTTFGAIMGSTDSTPTSVVVHECRKDAITHKGFPTTEPNYWCGEFQFDEQKRYK